MKVLFHDALEHVLRPQMREGVVRPFDHSHRDTASTQGLVVIGPEVALKVSKPRIAGGKHK